VAKVVVSRRAAADLQRLRNWLSEKDPDAADRAADAIDRRITRLQNFPRLGPLRLAPDTRELQVRFGRYGYAVRYVLRGDIVVVTRIFHGREDR
jgi:plasmid stabilization system protein ParE